MSWDMDYLIADLKRLRQESSSYRHRAKSAESKAEMMLDRLILAEATISAMRLGMRDVDAGVLIDISEIRMDERGALQGVSDAIQKFRKEHPAFFGRAEE